jgi:hypothetical protein
MNYNSVDLCHCLDPKNCYMRTPKPSQETTKQPKMPYLVHRVRSLAGSALGANSRPLIEQAVYPDLTWSAGALFKDIILNRLKRRGHRYEHERVKQLIQVQLCSTAQKCEGGKELKVRTYEYRTGYQTMGKASMIEGRRSKITTQVESQVLSI